ncbi:MAG: CooT family nickel-binding protein [Promethearchaeota archaeon]|nr:MAG: CooT family nickel-binding protein [Candidatus Lokiarchaeota archaeon]
MCEFKIYRKSDGSQIAEDILVLSYTDDYELILKDVLGMGEQLDSALILDVNTLNQKCVILQHPLIRDFIELILGLDEQKISKSKVDSLIKKLEDIKNRIKR